MTERTGRTIARLLPADLIAGWAAAAYAGGFIVWWLATARPDETSMPALALVHVPIGLLITFLTMRLAARTTNPGTARAVAVLGLAAVLFPVSDVLMAYLQRDDAIAAASVAGLLPYPVLCAAALLLPSLVRRPLDRTLYWIDMAIVVVGASMVLWALAFESFLIEPSGGQQSAAVVWAYACGAVIIVTAVASLLLQLPRGVRRPAVLSFALSLVVLVLADVAWLAHDVAAGLHHPVRAAHELLWVVAALTALRRRGTVAGEGEALTQPVDWLPYAAAAAGAVTFIVEVAGGTAEGLVALAPPMALLTLLLLARLALAVRDVERLRIERAVLASDARFQSMVHHAADMIYVVDSTWTITYVSPSVSEALGYRTSHLVGSSLLDLVHAEDVADTGSRLRECLVDPSRPMRTEWRVRRHDQTYIHTETACVNLMGDDSIRGIVLTARDVSERNYLEEQLTHRAFHDPLTGLANPALFHNRVQHALARRRGEQGRLGVVFIDMDYFKSVNDRLGHAGGDALLRAAALRLVSGLRAFDTAARLGGDEFAVLVDDIPRNDEVIQVAERIARAFREPFMVDGREVNTSASVGIALAAVGQNADELLRNADLAMYFAKNRGRGQAVLFEPSMHAAAVTRQELQRDLARALERGELSLVYQPIHALDTRAVVGAEALLRWVHPTRGPVQPATFLPIAEESGLMVAIGQWVLRTACVDAAAWRSRSPAPLPLRVWINLSSRQLSEEALQAHVAEAIAAAGISAGAVVLELTERMLLQHKDRALDLMEQLKALGVHLAIDDFGTGYSSLSHLQRLPIDILKIDRVFVDAIASDEHASALARTVVSLGESMSLEIVAEGIENADQIARLRAIGCNAGQGFFFGMPLSAADLADYADRSRSLSV